jgi:hypothetical protein
MSVNGFDINKVRVAAPCPKSWESMIGDERVRRCQHCELDIFNTAEMTEREIGTLISDHSGRLCIRLYRRPDGTVQTKDCSVGLRGARKRAATIAATMVAALLGLFSISYSQKRSDGLIDASKVETVKHRDLAQSKVALSGVIVDPLGAVIPGFEIQIFKSQEKKHILKLRSDDEGLFSAPDLPEGTYRIEVPSQNGFKKLIMTNLAVRNDRLTEVTLVLSPKTENVTVGIYTSEPLIDFSVSGPTPVTITRKELDRIPGGRPF